MSRGIRDLRDLICVSRLTVRHSDDEIFSSDDDLGDFGDNAQLANGSYSQAEQQLSRKLSMTSLDSETSASRENSARQAREPLPSPDSGIGTSNQSPQESQENVRQTSGRTKVPPPPLKVDDATPRSFRKKKRVRKKPQTGSQEELQLRATDLKAMLSGAPPSLPRVAPLPPVASHLRRKLSSGFSGESESLKIGKNTKSTTASKAGFNNKGTGREATLRRQLSESKSGAQKNVLNKERKEGDFDDMLTFIDANLLSEWLQLSNRNVTDLATFCHAGENFVQFAHFWLSEFPDFQKHEMFKLEYSILLDNLNFVFAMGREAGVIKHRDLQKFLEAVFREYPGKLLSVKGPHLFLDYLDVLSSERHDAYKKILSDVKCSTRVKSHAEWALGIRSYALVSVWTAVINFYRKFMLNSRGNKNITPSVPLSAVNKRDPQEVRIYQAIRRGYADVVNYLLRCGHVPATLTDADNKGLLFTAVVHNQPKVLGFLLKHVRPRLDVNQTASTGNTPLHAAANSGSVELVAMLLCEEGVQVNATNPQCDQATPLHLAVMHGHVGVVETLLERGADPHMPMGGLSALDIAKDFGHYSICNLLDEHRKQENG